MTLFRYHCAQNSKRQHKPKECENKENQRDKIAMAAFDCDGWLTVTISDQSDIAFIQISHKDDHIPYWTIDISPDVKDYVHENPHLTPKQVRDCFSFGNYFLMHHWFFCPQIAVGKCIEDTLCLHLHVNQFTKCGLLSQVLSGNVPKMKWSQLLNYLKKQKSQGHMDYML